MIPGNVAARVYKGPFPRRVCRRKPGPAAAVGHQSTSSETPRAPPMRQAVLSFAFPLVARLAVGTHYRPACDGLPVVSRRLRLFWRWRSRGARPIISAEIRRLFRRMARENTLWGVPRIQSKLKFLGHAVAAATISTYLPNCPGPTSSPTWRAFWKNHLTEFSAIDFFVVPNAIQGNPFINGIRKDKAAA